MTKSVRQQWEVTFANGDKMVLTGTAGREGMDAEGMLLAHARGTEVASVTFLRELPPEVRP